MSETPFAIRVADWVNDGEALQAIRREVFMGEQAVPEALEWDGLDDTALHLLAESADGTPIGTARLLPDGHIGRVAVIRPWRGRGVGRALMAELLRQARRQGHREARLDAQIQALPFYRGLGFTAYGDVFMDAGIPHRHMKRTT